MWAMPFGVALTLFGADLVHFGIGDKWAPAIVLLQYYGVTAAIEHIGYNWDAYMRAVGRTRPLMVSRLATMVVFLGAGLPLLIAHGLRGLAWGVAAQTAVHMAFRIHYLRQLFRGFAFGRHMLRAIGPTVPAVAVVLVARALEHGTRTAGEAVLELALYAVVTVVATWLLEGRLVREALSYLRSGRPAAAAG
jgi:O-antigen/teichoic acid export membrane protein